METERQKHVMRVATATAQQEMSQTQVLVDTEGGKIVQVDLYSPFR